MTALERAARRAWEEWSAFRKTTVCSSCGIWRYCGSRSRRRWLCIDCFDQERAT